MSKHNEHSSYREKLIEHLFIGELLKLSWINHDCGLEVAKPEVDNSGYDVLTECYGIVRHIQLKASHIGSSTAQQKVHVKLADKPSGCMVWIIFDENSLALKHFLFYGDIAGEPLPSLDKLKIAKHSKGNKDGIKAERHNIRIINKGQFRVISTIEDLYKILFCIEEAPEITIDVLPINKNIEIDDHNTEFTKLHRIEKWSRNKWQKNSQLITAFLTLEPKHTDVTLDQIIDYCMNISGGSKNEWKNNFNSMKTDHGNSHGKIFYLSGTKVNIFTHARNEIDTFFK